MMGKAWVFGDNVSTDYIIPGRFNITTDPKELRKHIFKYARPEFIEQVKPGDIVIGGKNFGCGSSREHAAIVLQECGIHLVAYSYGWIFKRNCINLGMLPFETEQILPIKDGDNMELKLDNLTIRKITTGVTYKLKTVPTFVLNIYKSGGLVEYLNKEKNYSI
jgi:3-isopropylmalate/(R)-2-methylmalate dehydratase small subunit